jgi:hypothetical protein
MSAADMPELLEHFNDLLTHLRQTNPIVQQFQTMLERNLGVVDHEVPNGCPIVPSTTLDNTVAAAQVCRQEHVGTFVPLVSGHSIVAT